MKIKAFVLVLLIPLFLFSGCSQNLGTDPDFIKAKKLLEYHANKYDNYEATGTLENGVRTIYITARQFSFDPELIIVNKGEKIKLVISAVDAPHGFEIEGFEIPGYDISTVIKKGATLTIEFTADEKGVWEFICAIYCGYGHSEMKGIFVIR